MISVLVAENRNLFTSKGHQGELEVSAEQSPSTFLCGSDGPSDSLFPCISLFSIERVPVRPRYQGYGRRQGNERVPRLLELLVIQSCISSFIQQVFFTKAGTTFVLFISVCQVPKTLSGNIEVFDIYLLN